MRRKASGWSIFQRADGRFVLAYQAEAGKWRQHVLESSNEREAKAEGLAWLAQQRAAGLVSDGLTIGDLWPRWIKLRGASPNLATSTVRDNRSHLERIIGPALGHIPIGKFTETHARDFVRGYRDGKAPSTVRNVVSTLAAFFEDARAEGWVKASSNVVRHPSVTREIPDAGGTTEGVVFVPIEAAQTLVLCESVHAHRRVRYTVAFLSGLRDGELQGLTWADIHLDEPVPYLEVRQAFALKASPEKYADLTDPKTPSSLRAVPLHEAAIAALRWWRAVGWEFYVGRNHGPTDAVFASVNGAHWRPKSAREFREDLSTAGQARETKDGDVIDFHATRRSFSTWLEDHGAEPETIDRMLGHRGKTTRSRHYTAAVLSRYAAALALLPFRWQDPPGHESSTSDNPHNAHIVPAHKEEPETASALVAQWTEQRFPKPPINEQETRTLADESAELVTVERGAIRVVFDAASLERRAAQFDRTGVTTARERESRRRELDDEVRELMLEVKRIALGDTSVAMAERPAYARGLLARAATLSEQRQRRAAKGAA